MSSSSSSSSSIRENMQRGVEATIKGFNTIDYNFLRATRSDDFLYQFLPLSLGQPARNNDEYKLFFDAVFPMYKKFIVTPKTLTYDVEARRCSLYGKVDTESPVGQWDLELVMMLTFDEAGEKVKRIDEFFDSAVYKEFFAKVQEMQAGK